MTEQRQDLYFNLIERLLSCPNGQEPEILDAQPDLLDAGLVKTMMQVATMMAHQDNQNMEKNQKFFPYIKKNALMHGVKPRIVNPRIHALVDQLSVISYR